MSETNLNNLSTLYSKKKGYPKLVNMKPIPSKEGMMSAFIRFALIKDLCNEGSVLKVCINVLNAVMI